MSRPIKETPVLTGKDAERFLEEITLNETDLSRRISRKEFEKSKKLYKRMLFKSNFQHM